MIVAQIISGLALFASFQVAQAETETIRLICDTSRSTQEGQSRPADHQDLVTIEYEDPKDALIISTLFGPVLKGLISEEAILGTRDKYGVKIELIIHRYTGEFSLSWTFAGTGNVNSRHGTCRPAEEKLF